MHLAFKYPNKLSAVAALSAPFDFANDVMLTPGLAGFYSDPKSFPDLDRLGMRTRAYFAWAAVKAPDPSNPPLYVQKPFRLEDGKAQAVPEVWDAFGRAGVFHELETFVTQQLRTGCPTQAWQTYQVSTICRATRSATKCCLTSPSFWLR